METNLNEIFRKKDQRAKLFYFQGATTGEIGAKRGCYGYINSCGLPFEPAPPSARSWAKGYGKPWMDPCPTRASMMIITTKQGAAQADQENVGEPGTSKTHWIQTPVNIDLYHPSYPM